MTTATARDRWTAWANAHGAEFADQQWLLSKYEVCRDISWPPEKVRLLTDMLWERLNLSPGHHVVELCCGGGWLVGHLARRRVRGTGLDFAENMVRVARRQWPEVRFTVADASACPLSDGCADAVLCYFALINIVSGGVRQAVLRESRRLLRNGGRAVIGHLPLSDRSSEYEAAKARYCSLQPRGSDGQLREDCQMPIVLFARDELAGLAAGFAEQRIEPSFNHFWLPGEPETCPWRVDLCLTR